MRGKEASDGQIGQVKRITPAYAGKRRHKPTDKSDDEDHPRVCGEKPIRKLLLAKA